MGFTVPDITSLEMLLRSLIVILPLLVLAVLFFLLAAKRRGGTAESQPADELLHPTNAGDRTRAEPPRPVGGAEKSPETRQCPPQEASLAATSAETVPPGAPAATAAALIAKLEAGIAEAEDAGATVELAEMYLALGRAHMAEGAEGEALSALRSAAGLAALYKAPKVQALARLDLAEVAMNQGDPITACEHWQMARMAFLDAGNRVEGDKIDRRMRAQGCPTDWVLTDF